MTYRVNALKSLKQWILDHEVAIFEALEADFAKPRMESVTSETGYILAEINHTLANMHIWAEPTRVGNSPLTFPSSSYILPQPYGVCTIIAPWNYPFQLALSPMIAALSAGNTVIVKPSEVSKHTSFLLEKLIEEVFERGYVDCVLGGVKETQQLLEQPMDYLFFTGSTEVGKIVYQAAAKHLTPVTLELGGKSPAIVDKTGVSSGTAQKIIHGKCYNVGQTCVAPDYILVEESEKEKLVAYLIQAITKFYGPNPEESEDYGRIINDKHFERLAGMLAGAQVLHGGQTNASTRYIAPTLVEVSANHPLLKEEIFGPILPIVTYTDHPENYLVGTLKNPLSIYIFSKRKAFINTLLKTLSFGGATVNDTLEHFVNPELPFGGIGTSGIGSYHGKFGFETFSHKKAILKKSAWLNFPLKYPPYRNKLNAMQKLFRIFG